MRTVMGVGLCAVVAACVPVAGDGPGKDQAQGSVQKWREVPGVSKSGNADQGILRATVDGREILAVVQWRAYSASRDGSVAKWYGDMSRPPPKFVVDQLSLGVNGLEVTIPEANYRYLCSAFESDDRSYSLSLNSQGKLLRWLVDVGDGAEGWTAEYVFDPATTKLISHRVADGPAVHNEIAPGG